MTIYYPSSQFDWHDNPRFQVRNLTRAIREFDNVYGRLAEIGLFSEDATHLPHVEIEVERDRFSLIPVSARGTPAPRGSESRRHTLTLKVLRLALDDYVYADAVMGKREFGTQDVLMDPMREVHKKMDKLTLQHFISLEYYRWGALKGDVYNADGTEVLYNTYELMGEEQKTFDFAMGGTVDESLRVQREIRRYMERNLKGATMGGLHFFCSSEFFEGLLANEAIYEVYKHQQLTSLSGPHPYIDNVGLSFRHGGAVYEEHNGLVSYKKPDGTWSEHRFIPEGEAIGVPLGTRDTFVTYFGPADFIDAVNVPPDEVQGYMYAKLKPTDDDRAIKLMTEICPLPMVLRPRLVVRCRLA